MRILPTAPGTRPGHFVDGRFYPLSNFEQAKARAAFLATTYGRPVYVLTRKGIAGRAEVSATGTDGRSASALILNCIGA